MEALNKKARQALRESRQLAKKEKAQGGKKKAKKGGMTHYRFRDAVSVLSSDKQIQPLENLGIQPLDASDLLEQSIVTYEDNALPLMKASGLFLRYQHHELFEKPVTMVSNGTKSIVEPLVTDLDKNTKNNRHILIGEKGVGKSTLLAQAHALAMSKHKDNVVLLHFEQPEKIVDGSSDYLFNKSKNIYQQPMFTKRWIGKTRFVNEKVFKKMPLSRDFEISTERSSFKLKKDTHTVYDFLFRSRDFAKVSSALDYFIEQLQHHSNKFPVLCTVDNFNGLLKETYTKYHHPNFKPIHVTEFEMGKLLLSLVNGLTPFLKGAVIVAESKSLLNTKTLNVALKLEVYDPYHKKSEFDLKSANILLENNGLIVNKVSNLTPEEARSLVLFYRQMGALHIRDYPTKEVITMPEEIISMSQIKKIGALPEVMDEDLQFEKLLKTAFNVSQGNPGHLLKAAVFDC